MKSTHRTAHSLYMSSALSSRHARLVAGLAFSIASLGMATNAFALPQNGNVVSGDISISQSGNQMKINQSTNRGIIDWKSFDILNGESVNINQAGGAASSELERVTGSTAPSQILGNLTSNGRVMIVNGAGVFFGPHSQVNVAGLIATSADISNANFNAGILKFDRPGNPDASIINKGTITAAEGGLVALVAPGVENDGVISARLGTVALGAGQAFTVDMYGDGLYSFSVDKSSTQAGKDENGNALAAAISNDGTVAAQGGTIYMTARAAEQVVDQAINTTGLVDATAAHDVGGTIVLDGGDGNVKVAGTLNASGKGAGQSGGKISVAGKTITLASGSKLDASGDKAGGSAVVGYDSRNPGSMTKADSTTLENGALIDVSSTSGTGGYAEVSGNDVTYDGFTDATGPQGFGTLVIDPGSWTISTASSNGSDTINNASLASQLNSANVTVDTNAGTNGHTPNINVNADVAWSGAGSLTLNAGNNIDVDANIESSWASGTGAQGAVALNAGGHINIGSGTGSVQVSTSRGNLTLDNSSGSNNISIGSDSGIGNVLVQTNNGTLTINSGNNINIGDASTLIGSTTIKSNNGDIDLNANSGNVNLNSATSGTASIADNSGNININSKKLNLNSNANPGSANINNANGNVTINTTGKVTLVGDSTINAGNNLNINNGGIFSSDFGSVLSGNEVSVNQNVGGSIQNAIDALGTVGSGGATVNVGAGAYTEQLDIHRDLTLNGAGQGTTTIQSPDTLGQNFTSPFTGKAIVSVHDTGDVTIENLTVDGLGKGNANNRFTGIAYRNAGGTVDHVTVTNIENTPFDGVQAGYGVYGYADNGTNRSLTVSNSNINSFQKNGIVIGGANLTGNVVSNTITGAGATSAIGQNGIEFISGGKGSATGNTISGIGYTPVSGTASDILLFQAGDNINVSGNTITGTGVDNGIYAYQSNGATIKGNTITGAAYAITTDTSNNAVIGGAGAGNTITGGTAGINVIDNNGTSVIGNTVTGSGTGILVDPSSNITVSGNTASNVGTGISVSDLSGTNSIDHNTINTTTADGIDAADSTGLTIASNLVGLLGGAFNINGDGIAVNNTTGVVIKGNQVSNTNSTGFDVGSGIHVSNTDGAIVGGPTAADGNTVTNINWDGIKFTGGRNATVENNVVDNTTRVGIYAGSLNTGLFANNTVSHEHLAGYGGISTDSGSNLTITGNILSNEDGDGIRVNGAGGSNLISRNTVDGTAQDGISSSGTSSLTISNNQIGQHTGIGTISGNGINVDHLTDESTITGNLIDNTGASGINAQNDTGLAIVNNNIGTVTGHIGGNGITVTNDDDVNANSNHIGTAGANSIAGNGVSVSGLVDSGVLSNTIINNTIDGITGDGVTATDSLYLGIGDNIIGQTYGIGHTGIKVDTLSADIHSNSSITGNTIDNTGSDGVTANNDSYLAINHNIIGTHAGHIGGNGITVTGDEKSDINYDTIQHTAGNGIVVSGLTGPANYILFDSIDYTTADGVDASSSVNLDIGRNWIGEAGAGSIGGYGIKADTLTANAFGNSSIYLNDIDYTAKDGIHASGDTGLYIVTNTIGTLGAGSIGGNGIDADTSVGADDNLSVQRNIVKNTLGDGITVSGLTGTNLIDTNYIDGIAGDGIYTKNDTGLTISNNQIGNQSIGSIGVTGIVAQNEDDVTVTGNTIDHALTGIQLVNLTDSGHNGNLIDSNTVDATGADGIYAFDSANATISNNQVGQNSGIGTIHDSGIDAYGLTGSNITGNTVDNTGGDGIHGFQDSNLAINGNFVGSHDGNIGLDGINVSSENNVTITGNTIAHTGTGHSYSGSGIWAQTLNDADGSGNIIDHNQVDYTGTGYDGIYINKAVYTTVNGNVIGNHGGNIGANGIDVSALSADGNGVSTVNGNKIDNTAQNGILASGDSKLIINGNAIGLNGGNIGADGINAGNENNVIIDSNQIAHTAGNGIIAASLNDVDGTGNDISLNHIDFTGSDGINVNTAVHTAVNGNQIGDNGGGINGNGITTTALTLNEHGISTVNGNSINHATGDGIRADSDTGLLINGNAIGTVAAGSIGGNGINVIADDNLTAQANTVQNTGHDGITVNGLTDTNGDNLIDSNHIDYVGGNGISAYNSAGLTISNNQIGLISGASGIGGDAIVVNNDPGVQITGNQVDPLQNGINVENSDGATVYNNTVSNAGLNGIDVNNSQYADISTNTISNSAGDGVLIEDGSDNGHVRFNTITSATNGVEVTDSTGTHVYDNGITNTTAGVLVHNGSDDTHVAANTISNATIGVDIEGSAGVHAWNNTIDNIVGNGIYANNANGLRVVGNSIGTAAAGSIGANGIDVENSDDVSILGNTVDNTHDIGIHAFNLTDEGGYGNSINSNIIDNTGSDGIRVNGGVYTAVNGNQIGQYGDGISGNGIAITDLSADTKGISTVNGNIIDHTAGDGINASNDFNTLINGNYIGTAGSGSISGRGITVYNDNNVGIDGNHIANTGAYGIYAISLGDSGNTGNTINTNQVDYTGSGYDGIYAVVGVNVAINGNEVGQHGGGIGSNGIEAYGLSYDTNGSSSITGNTIDNTTGNGIYANHDHSLAINGNTIGTMGAGSIGANGINVSDDDNLTAQANTVQHTTDDGITVSGLTNTNGGNLIDSNQVDYVDGNGISASNSAGLTISNNKIGLVSGASGIGGEGILATNDSGVQITGNQVDPLQSGIYVAVSDNASISGNTVQNAGLNGIDVEHSDDATIDNNTVQFTGNDGIYVATLTDNGGNGNFIINNTVDATHNDGIGAFAAANLTIDSNNIGQNASDLGSGIGGVGIKVADLTGNSEAEVNGNSAITNNTIDNTNGDGINTAYDTDLSVNGNVIGTHGHIGNDGIYGQGETNVTVDGNTITNTGEDGIALYDASAASVAGNYVGTSGDSPSIGGTGIEVNSGVSGSSNISITGNTVEGASTGISVSDLTGTNLIDGNTIDSVNGDGIDASGDQNLTISNNGIASVDTGISVNGDQNLTIDNDNEIWFANDGISVSNLTGTNRIDGNTIDAISGDGIDASGDQNLTISNNYIGTEVGIEYDGINVSGDQNVNITGNTIGGGFIGVDGDGIAVSNLSGTNTINDNTINTGGFFIFGPIPGGDGIYAEASSNLAIDGNTINYTGGDGIALYDVANASVTNNTIGVGSEESYGYISGTGIEVSSGETGSSNITIQGNTVQDAYTGIEVSDLTGTNLIDSNNVDYVDGDGIDVFNSQNVTVSNNQIGLAGEGSIGGFGINVDTLEDPSSNVTIQGNTIENAWTGISVANLTGDNLIDSNTIDYMNGDGIDIFNSPNITVSNNKIGTAEESYIGDDGIYVSGSDNVNFASNQVTNSGTGVYIEGSNNASFNGDNISSHEDGIVLDNAQHTTLNGVTLDNNGTDLYAGNGSGGTLVFSTTFTNSDVGIWLDGLGTTLQFGNTGSSMANVGDYFILSDNAMQGSILDASQQSFDVGPGGSLVTGSNFTTDELAQAETQTVDFITDSSLGLILYQNLNGPASNLLNQLLQRDQGVIGTLFSYAGYLNIGHQGTPGIDGYSGFTPQGIDLSLLGQGGAGAPPVNFSNLGSLSPSAGGTNASQYASLNPSAGGDEGDSCANSFLGNGLSTGNCGAK